MRPWIQVCGDPTVDWFRIHNQDVRVRGGVYYWQKKNDRNRVSISSKPGGSALVLQLLNEMLDPGRVKIEGAILDDNFLNRPKDSDITTSWTVWKEFDNPGFNHTSYRLWKWQEFEPASWDYASARLDGDPDLLIIQDSGLGFRYHEDGWPEVIRTPINGRKKRDIILKLGLYNDGQENPLLERMISADLAGQTTIISSLSDLRSCAVKVGESLSWERLLEEVVAAVFSTNCPFVEKSTQELIYKQVIIPIGLSGAVIVGPDFSTLIFDRSGQEGDFASCFPGQILGDNICIMGALAACWVENPAEMDWTKATLIGIELARLLQIIGYDVTEYESHRYLQFPYRSIAEAHRNLINQQPIVEEPSTANLISDLGIFVDEASLTMKKCGQWTILEETLLEKQSRNESLSEPQSIASVNQCARNIVIQGHQTALRDVPVETIGRWCSVDRHEIEGVRSVNNAMRDYLAQNKPGTPLGLAVFGPPGAGKSFVIKEIAANLGIGEDAQLTFNLSQFESPAELQSAFYQIRDLNLQSKTPLVFWDEFDTPCEGRALGWLRYFLSPLQDGVFSEQGISHPLGGGVYVFAGATRHSFEEFRWGNTAEDRAAKKPDFISRLSAFINIRGINGNPNTVEDRLYMIRRAFILRQYLETNTPQIIIDNEFQIETGVLDALLLVTRYEHGARSLENLLKMSNMADKRKYELSSIPPDHILQMHVNVKEFNDLMFLGHRQMVRIGISGHMNLLQEHLEILQKAIVQAIEFIERQFPDHYLTVFSPLVLGADRLVARELLKKDDSRLIAVLPVSQDEYINDFGTTDDYRIDSKGSELRQEFRYWLSTRAIEVIEMPPMPTRMEAYLMAGHFITEHSDLMIVVWDGQELPCTSITSQSVRQAEILKMPICHIWAPDVMAHLSRDRVGEQVGRIRYKNFPNQIPGEWLEL